MTAVMWSPLLLVLVALVLRLVPLRRAREAWSTSVDVGLAVGLGVVTAAVKAWYLAVFAMTDGTDTFDLPDMCLTVEALRSWDLQAVVRQPVAALLPTALSYPLGLFDGVAAGALISAAALGAAMYLWGMSLFGRAAGVAAAVLSCAVNPLVVMTRQMTFYPEAVAAFALCAAGAAAAVRWRGLPALGLAGAGIGLALAAEHTGLVFAAVPAVLCMAVALRAPRRRWPLRLAVFLGPVLLSWCVARVVTPPGMRTFEDKAATFTADNVGHPLTNPFLVANQQDTSLLMTLRRWAYPGDLFRYNSFEERQGYHWGRSGPVGMVQALATVALLSLEEPSDEVRSIADARWDTKKNRSRHVAPWIPLVLMAVVVCVAALWRHRWELAVFWATLSPFAVLLGHTASSQVHAKTLMAPMLPIPVVLGVAWVALAQRDEAGNLIPAPLRRLFTNGKADSSPASPPLIYRAASIASPGLVLALLVTGVVPTWLAPTAPWRLRSSSDPDFYNVQALAVAKRTGQPGEAGKPRREACHTMLADDLQRGIPSTSRLYPRKRFEQRWINLRTQPGSVRTGGGLPPPPPPPPPPTEGVPGRR